MVVSIVGRGNANIVCVVDHDDTEVYRISVRFGQLSANNTYVQDNYKYIDSVVRNIGPIGDLLVPMRIQAVPAISELGDLAKSEGVAIDEEYMSCIVMPHLYAQQNIYKKLDHFNRVHFNEACDLVTWEFKPKWLYQSTDYCRNCSHNAWKGRGIGYCFLDEPSVILHEVFETQQQLPLPREFLDDITKYLSAPDNILQRLYAAQLQAKDDLALLMILRDVTCFLSWSQKTREISVKVVDVDLKPMEKLGHWKSTEAALSSLPNGMKRQRHDFGGTTHIN